MDCKAVMMHGNVVACKASGGECIYANSDIQECIFVNNGQDEVPFRGIGNLIKHHRTKQKISKKTLAEETGFSIRAIDYWEKDERNITLENADKILKALKVQIYIGDGGSMDTNVYMIYLEQSIIKYRIVGSILSLLGGLGVVLTMNFDLKA